MNDAAIQKKNLGRGFWIMLTIICALVFGGTALWYYAAEKLEETVTQIQQNLRARGQVIACENQQVRGYPFRIGIFCDAINIEDKNTRQKLTSSALRTAAQIYDPGKFIVEFDGPGQFNDPRQGTFKIDWQFLRASMRATLDGIEHTSVVGHALTIDHETKATPLFSAETIEYHMRKLGENDLDIAIGSRNIALAIGQNASKTLSKPFDLSMEITANDLFQLAQNNQDLIAHIQENGGSANLNAFTLKTENSGILKLKGPLSVNTKGQLSAILDINATQLNSLFKFFKEFSPASNEDLEQIELAIRILFAGTASSKIQIQIKNGEVHLGLISLGRIPPLF